MSYGQAKAVRGCLAESTGQGGFFTTFSGGMAEQDVLDAGPSAGPDDDQIDPFPVSISVVFNQCPSIQYTRCV